MTTRLQHLFDILETDRRRLLEKIAMLTPDQFTSAPPGKWSVSQILAHVLAAEKMSRAYMEKKILGIQNAPNSTVVEEAKMLLLQFSQRVPFKFKAPAVVVKVTSAYQHPADLISAWDEERSSLFIFLERIKTEELRRKIYKHVIMGKMNIQHALKFFREHFHHHLPQINHLL